VAPYKYTWTYPNGTEVYTKDISGLTAGVYTLKIEDSIGLTYAAIYEITQPEKVEATILGGGTIPYCQSGTLTAELTGGVAPYTYKWTDGSVDNVLGTEQTLSGLTDGVYYLYAYDANGCLGYSKENISTTEHLHITAEVTDVKCYGFADGAIDINVTGGTAPYSYSWSGDAGPISSDEVLNNLEAGLYSVIVTDANGCSFAKEFTVFTPEKLELVVNSVVNPSEYGANDGSIDIKVSGGIAPYTYKWRGLNFEADTEDVSNLAADYYKVYVTDANGCLETNAIELKQPEPKPFVVKP
jgi:hypothetical protein